MKKFVLLSTLLFFFIPSPVRAEPCVFKDTSASFPEMAIRCRRRIECTSESPFACCTEAKDCGSGGARSLFCDINTTWINTTARNMKVCTGKFDTVTQLGDSKINIWCLTNSATLVGCNSTTTSFNYTMKNLPGYSSASDGSKYYTCFDINGIDRNVGSLKISISGDGISCSENAAVRPNDYDYSKDYIPNSIFKSSDALCNDVGVKTAFGCLMAGDPKQLISQLLGWGVVVGGGVAFVMILIAGFQITTAAGDPKKVQAARELLTAAISGLLLIVFSVLILNLIGFSILKLPGFSVPL